MVAVLGAVVPQCADERFLYVEVGGVLRLMPKKPKTEKPKAEQFKVNKPQPTTVKITIKKLR